MKLSDLNSESLVHTLEYWDDEQQAMEAYRKTDERSPEKRWIDQAIRQPLGSCESIGRRFVNMSWKQFEQYCETLIKESLDSNRYRITPNYRKAYGDQLKIMDIHIAEKRQGGRGFVVDCKHFTSPMPRSEIDTTAAYKKLCRASKALMLVSNIDYCSDRFLEYADSLGVEVIQVDMRWATRKPRVRKFLKRQLKLDLPEF